MGLDDFLCVWDHEFPVVIKKPVQHLEHLGGSQIELIEYDPMSLPYSSDKRSLLEYKVAHRVADVRAQVFLHVSVGVVVDAHKLVTSAESEVLHKRGFACVKVVSKPEQINFDLKKEMLFHQR